LKFDIRTKYVKMSAQYYEGKLKDQIFLLQAHLDLGLDLD